MTNEAVIELLKAQPFEPFDIRLADGRTVTVTHPELVAVSPGGRKWIVMRPKDKFTIIDRGLVISLEAHGTNGHSRRKR